MLHDVLLDPRTLAARLLREPVVRRLLDEHRRGVRGWHAQLWSLLVLELWHRMFVDRRPAAGPPLVPAAARGAAARDALSRRCPPSASRSSSRWPWRSRATLACERLAARLGLVVAPRADRWHRRPVALLGGVAIMLGVLPALAWTGGLRGRLAELTLVALAMGAVGLVDDIRPLRPPVKLVAQIALAGPPGGARLRAPPHRGARARRRADARLGRRRHERLQPARQHGRPGRGHGGHRRAASGCVSSSSTGDLAAATMTAGFVGAVLGFLVRNAPPARIFMGDAGSLFLGFFLSGLCLVVDAAYYSRGITAVLAVPVLLVLIPIFDTTFVTVTRLLRGQPVSQGGRDHTSHRLVALGGSERRALAVLFGLSILGGGVALLTYRADIGTDRRAPAAGPRGAGAPRDPPEPGRGRARRRRRPPAGRSSGSCRTSRTSARWRPSPSTPSLIVVAYYAAYVLRFEETFAAEQADADPHAGAGPRVPALRARALRGVSRACGATRAWATCCGSGGGSRWAPWRASSTSSSRRGSPACRAPCSCSTGCSSPCSSARAGCRSGCSARRSGRPGPAARPVLVYGAGDGGELVLRELRNNAALGAGGRGVHRRRPGEGGDAHPRRARAGRPRRARGAPPGSPGRGGGRGLAQDPARAAPPSGGAPARRTGWPWCGPRCGSSDRARRPRGGTLP